MKIYNSKSEYSPEEAFELEQAFAALEEKAAGGELTIEETRIRVAYARYKREDNFKIAATKVKAIKAPKEPKPPKEPKIPKEPKVRKSRAKQIDNIALAGQLLYRKNQGEVLTEEENLFLQTALAEPPAL